MTNSKEIGNFGESITEEYLIKSGYRILERNFYCRIGEIDIIAENNNFICFIEVKTRHKSLFGNPCEAVNKKKQIRIIKTAEFYILKNTLFSSYFRFDVIEVFLDKESYNINHIKNAFQK